jgi:hypothetical protein
VAALNTVQATFNFRVNVISKHKEGYLRAAGRTQFKSHWALSEKDNRIFTENLDGDVIGIVTGFCFLYVKPNFTAVSTKYSNLSGFVVCCGITAVGLAISDRLCSTGHSYTHDCSEFPVTF